MLQLQGWVRPLQSTFALIRKSKSCDSETYCTPLLWCHKILGNKTVCSVRQYANLNGRHRTTEKESQCLFIVSHNLNRCVTSHINICMYVLLLCYYMTA